MKAKRIIISIALIALSVLFAVLTVKKANTISTYKNPKAAELQYDRSNKGRRAVVCLDDSSCRVYPYDIFMGDVCFTNYPVYDSESGDFVNICYPAGTYSDIYDYIYRLECADTLPEEEYRKCFPAYISGLLVPYEKLFPDKEKYDKCTVKTLEILIKNGHSEGYFTKEQSDSYKPGELMLFCDHIGHCGPQKAPDKVMLFIYAILASVSLAAVAVFNLKISGNDDEL